MGTGHPAPVALRVGPFSPFVILSGGRRPESKDLDAVLPTLNAGGSSVESGVEILRLAPLAQDDRGRKSLSRMGGG